MEIIYDTEKGIVCTTMDGCVAYVEFRIEGHSLDIRHTYVPKPLEGRGIASELVRYTYDYAEPGSCLM